MFVDKTLHDRSGPAPRQGDIRVKRAFGIGMADKNNGPVGARRKIVRQVR